ncbi:uncharacterized protein LOC105764811 [Gossypium raimondii]|uniref:uncharacterized protein LOC105764811 n=1 Tax=Gossypium raimondii TaxID=29730 RepID=UPI00227BBD97|nr:uncharacterized protein LOC105764811 [Gossypium raimondii]
MENIDYQCGVDANDLSLVPDLVLPPKFKMPEFEKYNGTSCPGAHITMFCRRMTGYVNNDQLLIHCFQDSLIGSATRWYNQLSRAKVSSWKDLAQAFMKQYGHVTDITPDRITLQNMEKKQNESFRQYAQRWREVATQVQPPLLEREVTMLFINTLKAPFISHMLGSATKSFSDMVMSGEMIENAIRSGKIEAGENFKRLAPRKKDNEVNNVSTYSKSHSKPITVGPPKMITPGYQTPSRQEPNTRPNTRTNTERFQFTPIPITYGELYQKLFDAHIVSPHYLEPMQPPYPKWYDMNAQCEYHAGISGHSIENCTVFKKAVERFIKMGLVKLDDPSGPNVAGNPLPNLSDKGVNVIIENGGRRIKDDIAKVNTPLKWVWRQMINRGLIKQESKQRPKGIGRYCEFHAKEGHDIQNCTEFRVMVQNMMDNKELKFYKEIKGLEKREVYASEEGPARKAQNRPVVIISRPRNTGSGIQLAPKVIIQKPVAFPYQDSKKVPWNYNCNVMIPGEENPINASKEGSDVGFYTRSGKRYDPANTKEESMKGKAVHSEYSVVEQLRKQLARISVLKLLLSSESHRNALIKVLNETYVANDISVSKLDRLVNNINAENFIFFNDDEIPPGGMGSTKALHITARCKGCTLPGILVDNGSALNVLPLSTLNRLLVDSSHMKSCQNIVRAFDGTEKRVMGRIEIPLLIGPSTYEVDFLSQTIVTSPKGEVGSRGRLVTIGAKKTSLRRCSEEDLENTCGGRVNTDLVNKQDRYGLGYKPNARERRKEMEKKQEKRRTRLSGIEAKWGPITFPHISKTFVSEGIVYPEEKDEVTEGRIGRSSDINKMSDAVTDSGSLFEQDVSIDDPQDFEDDQDSVLSPDLLRMVEEEEKQILPYKESVEVVSLEEVRNVKIGTGITKETRRDLVELLQEFKDVFAWSYQDMPGLSTDIVVHRLPIKEECKPV